MRSDRGAFRDWCVRGDQSQLSIGPFALVWLTRDGRAVLAVVGRAAELHDARRGTGVGRWCAV